MMRTIAVHYHRRPPGRAYRPTYEYLKSFPAWCHLMDSLWLVRTDTGVADMRNQLDEIIGDNDVFAVFDVTGADWATNFANDQTMWMMSNMDHAHALSRAQAQQTTPRTPRTPRANAASAGG